MHRLCDFPITTNPQQYILMLRPELYSLVSVHSLQESSKKTSYLSQFYSS